MRHIEDLNHLSKKVIKILPCANSDLDKISIQRWKNIIKILEENHSHPLDETQFVYNNVTKLDRFQNVLECIPMGDRYKFYYTPIGMVDNSESRRLKLSISINVTLSKTILIKDLEEKADNELPDPKSVLKIYGEDCSTCCPMSYAPDHAF